MSRSLFSKYFMTCIGLILVSIFFLGTSLLVFAAQYLKFQKQTSLEKQVNMAVTLTDEACFKRGYEYLPVEKIKETYVILSKTIDADIYFTDIDGGVRICSEENCKHASHKVTTEILKTAKNENKYYQIGNMNGFLSANDYYTIGVPVYNRSGEIYGYLFISALSTTEKVFLDEIFKIFSISAIVVVMLTFIIIYFITDNLVKPLKQMASAVRSFGNGDFSVKVPVDKGYNEISSLAMCFNNMAEEIKTFEKTRRSFVANISHDLKTPMTSIGGFVDGILDGTIPPEKHKYYLKIVSGEVKRLARLVNVMMNVAKIEAGEINLNLINFNLFEIAIKIMFTFEQKIEEKELTVKGLDDPKVLIYGDPDLISQVVYNLIDNAVKFVNVGGYISFEFLQDTDKAFFSITNSGKGIKRSDLDNIFNKFYKIDKSRGRDVNGVGLGLYIVKSIINAHGGDIMVNSVENEYCKFTFTLPVANEKNYLFKKIINKNQNPNK